LAASYNYRRILTDEKWQKKNAIYQFQPVGAFIVDEFHDAPTLHPR